METIKGKRTNKKFIKLNHYLVGVFVLKQAQSRSGNKRLFIHTLLLSQLSINELKLKF